MAATGRGFGLWQKTRVSGLHVPLADCGFREGHELCTSREPPGAAWRRGHRLEHEAVLVPRVNPDPTAVESALLTPDIRQVLDKERDVAAAGRAALEPGDRRVLGPQGHG